MQKVTWLRTHVPIRNGERGISTSFQAPDYDITLHDRVFTIRKRGEIVTATGIENVVEFTLGDAEIEQETSKKARQKVSA